MIVGWLGQRNCPQTGPKKGLATQPSPSPWRVTGVLLWQRKADPPPETRGISRHRLWGMPLLRTDVDNELYAPAARVLVRTVRPGWEPPIEPRVVLPHLSFEGLDPVLARAVEFLAPTLERFVDPHAARRVAEWTARLTVLYFDDTAPFDLSDPADVRQLVAIHVLPGIDAAVQQEQ